MSGFGNKLELECLGDRNWRLTASLFYRSDLAECSIVVPAGFPTDLLSTWCIPFIAEICDGDYQEPGALHDYLYSCHMFTRAESDDIFI